MPTKKPENKEPSEPEDVFQSNHTALQFMCKKGLDRETNNALLLKHIIENREGGSRFSELTQVLPALSNDQVKKLVAELKKEEIHIIF